MEQCIIPGTKLNNPCDSIKAIYPTQVTLLLTEILFSLFYAKIHSLVLLQKYYSTDLSGISWLVS